MPDNDHDEIRRLIASQAQHRDDNLLDEWVANWTADGVFVAGGSHEGREAIAAKVGPADPAAAWRALHLLSESVIDVDGDRATATTDFVQIRPEPPDGRLGIGGVFRYRDEFRREDGRWYFSRRAAETKYRGPQP